MKGPDGLDIAEKPTIEEVIKGLTQEEREELRGKKIVCLAGNTALPITGNLPFYLREHAGMTLRSRIPWTSKLDMASKYLDPTSIDILLVSLDIEGNKATLPSLLEEWKQKNPNLCAVLYDRSMLLETDPVAQSPMFDGRVGMEELGEDVGAILQVVVDKMRSDAAKKPGQV